MRDMKRLHAMVDKFESKYGPLSEFTKKRTVKVERLQPIQKEIKVKRLTPIITQKKKTIVAQRLTPTRETEKKKDTRTFMQKVRGFLV